MANLVGVANPLPIPTYAQLIGGANINCPAGAETNIIAISPNPLISQGIYYPLFAGAIDIVVGATPMTFCTYNFRIGNGADLNSLVWPQTGWGANAMSNIGFYVPIVAYTVWPNPPPAYNISITPSGGSCTVQTGGSFAFCSWVRGPDQ